MKGAANSFMPVCRGLCISPTRYSGSSDADAALQRRNHWAAEADIGMKGMRTAFAG
ncbi:hypothetical protein ACW6U8_17945 [Bacillus subtilis]